MHLHQYFSGCGYPGCDCDCICFEGSDEEKNYIQNASKREKKTKREFNCLKFINDAHWLGDIFLRGTIWSRDIFYAFCT